MTTKRPLTGAIALIVATAGTACGKDATTEPEEATLDQVAGMQIASTLMSEIITIGFSALYGSDAAAGASIDGATTAVTGGRVPITETVPCQGGGTITVQGSYTNGIDNAGTGSMAFDLRQIPNGCIMSTTQGAYTVNGNPDFTVAGNLSVSSWALGVFNMTYGGGFRWSGRGGSGGCTIDLTYTFDYASSTFTGSGHMCGYAMNFSQTG